MKREFIVDITTESVSMTTVGNEMRIVITPLDDQSATFIENFIRGQQRGRDVVLAYVAVRDMGMERQYTWPEFIAKYPDSCSEDQYSRWQRKGVEVSKWIRQVKAMGKHLRGEI
jgi:hypothetical protein